ncbi:hypothetical protein ND486_21465 [Pseudonocardia sp. DR1-2]|uniref:hypothetical protein n=1 Tax=Pseudonocardia sp. DR1-2 TaxID=2951168 RepID=UPI002042EB21|nr:hypothetical protein [Pseudonocardia sp. DR1-2]MCM3848763.1 hypothetical protein [Pseudonocardia sp. DR1-2]
MSLLTALLVYFGSVRSRATFDYFAVDPSMVSYTNSEFAIRSVNSVYIPLVEFTAAWLLCTSVLRLAPTSRRQIRSLIRAAGLTALSLGVLTTAIYCDQFIDPRSALVIGFTGLLSALLKELPEKIDKLAILGPAILLAVLLLFMAIGWQAEKVGREFAERFAVGIHSQPELIIRSDRPIGVSDGAGVRTYTAAPSTGYKFETQGFRLLTRAGGNYILVRPDSPRSSVTYLPIAPEFRLEAISRQ